MKESSLPSPPNAAGSEVSYSSIPWQVKVFILALLIPTEYSFNIGDFRLTVYRVVLLISFLPCFFKTMKGEAGKTLLTDWLFCGYSFWIILSLSLHMGLAGGLKSGGILVIEALGSYLLARIFIRSEMDYASFAKLLISIIIALSFITIPESLTGTNLLRPYAGHIGGRLGLTRAFGPFDHPILYGMFCASAVSLALYVPIKNLQDRNTHLGRSLWMIVASFMSVSSGALATALIQMILALWNRVTRNINARWRIFSFLLVLAYITIDLLSNRTPIKVILHRLTFSAATAYNRIFIWEWGTKRNVAEHPWFGIGFNDWVRPSWMHSTSMDNFWLVNMVRFGLPAFAFLAAGGLILMFKVKNNNFLSPTAQLMRTAWGFSIIGLIIGGCTVHFWNQSHVWFFFLLGSGAWMAAQDQITPKA